MKSWTARSTTWTCSRASLLITRCASYLHCGRNNVVAMTSDNPRQRTRAEAGRHRRGDAGITGWMLSKQTARPRLTDGNYVFDRRAVSRAHLDLLHHLFRLLPDLDAPTAEIAILFLSTLFGWAAPGGDQLLWLNLLSDGAPALALGTGEGRPRHHLAGLRARP